MPGWQSARVSTVRSMTSPKNAIAGRKPQIRSFRSDTGLRAWSAKEDEVLTAKYPVGGSVACMAELPGRTRVAIYRRAQRLQLDNGYVPPYKAVDASGVAWLHQIAAGELTMTMPAPSPAKVPGLEQEAGLAVW